MAIRCDRCGAEFDSRGQLVTLVRDDKHGAIPGGGLICNACGMAFSSQKELDAHARAEHGARSRSPGSRERNA
jgi:uncharacterized C2H2 Zn-finger protein